MKTRYLGPLLLLASAPVVLSLFYFLHRAPTRELEALAELPDFHLTESSGKPISLADLRGKVWVANFLFTNCPGQCPMLVAKLKVMLDRLRDEKALRIVSFTVDPENDTPEVLSAYAEQHGADRQKWFFVTGPQAELNALSLKGFRLGDGGTPTAHSFKLVLVDSQAKIRGYYDGLDDRQVELLGDDARSLVRSLSR